MIVFEGEGDILRSEIQTLVCPVNTVGAMGAGLALAMRRRFKGLYPYYQGLCYEKRLKTGVCAIYKVPDTAQQILLFPTKKHWRDPSRVKYIETGLEYLMEHLASLEVTQIAVPPIGCGLGNLDYTTQVKPLLHKYLDPEEDLEAHLLLPPPQWT